MDNVKIFLNGMVDFNGCIRRSVFWLYMLMLVAVYTLIVLFTYLLSAFVSQEMGALFGLFSCLFLYYCFFCAVAKRYRDFSLSPFIPLGYLLFDWILAAYVLPRVEMGTAIYWIRLSLGTAVFLLVPGCVPTIRKK